MNHPYLRAYMAGITFPSLAVMLGFFCFALARYGMGWTVPLERLIIFPLAIVPNLWGFWNMLYVATGPEHKWSLGLHGAVLPFLLAPAGYALQQVMGLTLWPLAFMLVGFPIAVGVYYLLWKNLVGFFNETLGIG